MKKLLSGKLLTVLFTALLSIVFTSVEVEASEKTSESKLQSNETYLYYMNSDSKGIYLLDPNAEFENIILIEVNNYTLDKISKVKTSNLRHGKKFIGTFTDDSLWELVEIREIE